ncbi:hypothetical protein [Bacillus stercoris]|uniref:hypothetical protein n=1 Tax=Bacillus stercoris TaxID=2054641 RepID=UPI003F75DAA6
MMINGFHLKKAAGVQMMQKDVRKARGTALESMHNLTAALLQLLNITFQKRENTNYSEELRLFSALCSLQANMGHNLSFMIGSTEKSFFQQHEDTMKNMIHQTNQFFDEAPSEFKLHPLTKYSMRKIQMWIEDNDKAATLGYSVSKKTGIPSPPWFNQQFTNEKGETNE